MLKKVAGFLFVAFLLVVFGCGGGGGGGVIGPPPPPGNGIPNVVVEFFDSVGNFVGSGTTDANGNFSVQIPTEARYFQPLASSINLNTHYRAYRYGNVRYTPIDPQCRTPLPTLVSGSSISLPGGTIFIPAQGGVPPAPPNGCQAPPIGSGSGGVVTISGHVETGN